MRQSIVDYARTLVGTRYHHQGRIPGVGLDCIGVIVAIARHFGFTHHDITGYPRRPDGVTLNREFHKDLVQIEVPSARPGDVLTFWCEAPGRVQHCALLTDRGILHSTIYFRRVVEHRLDDYWKPRLAGAFKFREVE